MECQHRCTDRPADDRRDGCGGECGVQPRRASNRFWQFRRLIRLWDVGTTATLIGTPWSGHTRRSDESGLLPGRPSRRVGQPRRHPADMGCLPSKTFGDPMKGHTGTVTGVAVSSNGHRIVSSSEDRNLRMWDAATGSRWPGHHRSHPGGEQRLVQPRSTPRRVSLGRRSIAVVAGASQGGMGNAVVRQAFCQHDPCRVEQVGVAEHRLRQGLRGPSRSAQRLVSRRRDGSGCRRGPGGAAGGLGRRRYQ